MTRLERLQVEDLYELMNELESIMNTPGFNGRPFSYRVGVRRMRTYLDHVASGLRMMRGGGFEPHDVWNIHRKRKEQWMR